MDSDSDKSYIVEHLDFRDGWVEDCHTETLDEAKVKAAESARENMRSRVIEVSKRVLGEMVLKADALGN